MQKYYISLENKPCNIQPNLKRKQKLTEIRSWNSWAKNVPVRPLAPRRRTPVELYPIFNSPPDKIEKE